ncbi:SusC/RagA family TonB-linked outer membrane protein [Flavobacterium sp. I-SCBP12n]|uniref:SusC/RagA family TonB-linked outer membrane protein n=1 Tax=Flavobacterium pygoscelis TaxID=2893176 RepID=A0A9X1XU32_9FLAO|nr:SusC/RagA family TonB-linked outer membrane protein [Flavobacterium pygoscelis]MCK8141451.1 SusC/RagA family TonB-linked outer membrane protein [Flavobacterium pygoscelis]
MKKFSLTKRIRPMVYSFIVGSHLFSATAKAHNNLQETTFQQQHQKISGTITDRLGPLPGVTINIKGTSTTTISDYNGQYAITANPNATLIFSFMGFKTVEIEVDSQKIVNVQLKEDATALQEVKINAGYYSVKEKERTGSIVRMTAKDIATQPVTNVLATMQGRMAGVNIVQSTGTPGGGFDIQIRGISSLRTEGNTPLYIIDGMPYPSQSLGNGEVSSGVLPKESSPLNSINPSDIESIEVLKDADATAIYGSRGANGVVLISTKKGNAGTTKFNVSAYTSIGIIANKLKVLNTQQYLAMRQEAFANDGITQHQDDAYDINGTWSQTRNTNWQKELIGGTSYIQNAQTSVSGGSENTQFMLGGTYRDESTVTRDNGHYSKGAVHSSMIHKTSDDSFHLNFSADYTSDKNTLPGMDLSRLAYTLAPNAPALYDNAGNLNWEEGTFENPLGYLEGTYLSLSNNLIANAMIVYKFYPGFEFKTSVGFNDTKFSENRTLPSTMYNPIYNPTSLDSQIFNNNSSRSSWIVEPQLNWVGKLGEAEINVLVGTTFQSQKQQLMAVYGAGFPSNTLIHSLTAASNVIVINDDRSEYKYSAFFTRVNLNYKDRYVVNLTARRDGSSRFGPGNRFANFGAIGAAWLFSKEAFINSNFLSFGKFRTSYGLTGNDQIGDYQYLDTYSVTSNVYDGGIGLQPTRLFNPHFGWETNKKMEAALELGFFKDRIFLSTAWFQNRSSNQLIGIPLSGTTGFSSVQANLEATVQNTGYEIELHTVNLTMKDFKWTTALNFTAPKNKLLNFPGLEGSVYANTFVIGESISIQKLYHYTGIDPVNGAYNFKDFNGDGQLTSADRKSILDTSPKFYGGLGNNLSYKNWNLDFLLQFVKQEAANELLYFPVAGTFSNQPTAVLNHFPLTNNLDTVQQYTSGANGTVFTAQNYYTQSDALNTNASYVRLKSASLTYSIPSAWSKGFSAKVYLQGQNLFTLTKYSGVDPETKSIYYLPPLRQFTLGIQVGF